MAISNFLRKRLLLGEVLGLLIGIIGLVVIGVVTAREKPQKSAWCGYGLPVVNQHHFDCTLEISAVPR